MDVTTLGVKFGYAVETTAGTRPTASYIQLPRCKSIGGISLEQEQIDISTLEDLITKYAEGRQDTGGSWEVVFHSDALTKLKTMLTEAATAKTNQKGVWFVVWIPGLTDSFFVKAQPGAKLPMGEIGANSVLEFPISLVIGEYEGMATAIEPAA